MSIHAENHQAESQMILQPDIVVITNTWPDHIGAHGSTDDDVASVLSNAITRDSTLFVPEPYDCESFRDTANRKDAKTVLVTSGSSSSVTNHEPEGFTAGFSENADLVYAVSKHLGVDDKDFAEGLALTQRDAGAYSIREVLIEETGNTLYTVNAFAANDPESTRRIVEKAKKALPPKAKRFVGLLCLRSDRADRTIQWLDALSRSRPVELDRLYVTGGHARAVVRRTTSATCLTQRTPEALWGTITREVDADTVILGFGNYVGMGEKIAEYWKRVGNVYGI